MSEISNEASPGGLIPPAGDHGLGDPWPPGAIRKAPEPAARVQLAPATGATGLPIGLQRGVASFQALVRRVMAQAVQREWSRLVLCDPDFEAWPLGESQLVADLMAWSRRGREVVLLAHRFDAVQARHARFVTWRKTWSHIVECCVVATTDRELPQGMIWTPEWALQVQDAEGFACIGSENQRFRAELSSKLDLLRQRSRPGFAVNILGL